MAGRTGVREGVREGDGRYVAFFVVDCVAALLAVLCSRSQLDSPPIFACRGAHYGILLTRSGQQNLIGQLKVINLLRTLLDSLCPLSTVLVFCCSACSVLQDHFLNAWLENCACTT